MQHRQHGRIYIGKSVWSQKIFWPSGWISQYLPSFGRKRTQSPKEQETSRRTATLLTAKAQEQHSASMIDYVTSINIQH